MAALPPQPPGNLPPSRPASRRPVALRRFAPPPGPYSPGNAYVRRQSRTRRSRCRSRSLVKVHKRTFWLTIAQIIIIVKAILVHPPCGGVGRYRRVHPRRRSRALRNIPGYDNYANQFGNSFVNAGRSRSSSSIAIVPALHRDRRPRPWHHRRAAVERRALDHHRARRPQHPRRDRRFRSREHRALGDLIIVVYLALQVIVLYALAARPGNPTELRGQSPISLLGRARPVYRRARRLRSR